MTKPPDGALCTDDFPTKIEKRRLFPTKIEKASSEQTQRRHATGLSRLLGTRKTGKNTSV